MAVVVIEDSAIARLAFAVLLSRASWPAEIMLRSVKAQLSTSSA
jgi:hypothetical protein